MRVVLTGLSLLGILAPRAFCVDELLASRAVAILQSRCSQCHSGKVSMAGFLLGSRDQVLRGGGRGPAIKPGNSKESLLIAAVSHEGKLVMPPGPKLPAEEIETLRTWVDQGAPWPERAAASSSQPQWWAFRKPQRPPVPETAGAHTPVDAFILARLRHDGIEPAPQASRFTLLKRATYDLLGLPPTPEQVASFMNDAAPDAWNRLIDSLLSSPHYGEKWGQHWLDLVRYGDTGGFEQDPYILEAWRFRDYVIKSFNDDKPYDRFAKEQLAGDEIWPEDPEARTGTGYYRVGANRDMLFKVEDLNRVEKLSDYVDTTSQVFLGLTTGCARCHDHKFDPIPQRDFYRMQAIFAPAVNDRVFLEYNSARFSDLAANSREFRLRQIGGDLSRILNPVRDRLRSEKIAKLPAEVRAAFKVKAEDRTPEQQALVTRSEADIRVPDEDVRAALTDSDREQLNGLERKLVSIFTGHSAPPMAPGVIDAGREAPKTFIALRGNAETPGDEVGPGFLTCLGGGEVPEPPLHAISTGRRKALAEWLAGKENPLFARVMANRIWQHHFGAGLVRTPSDFGVRAGKPAYPELLDFLATEFAERGFSIKAMHRLIMTSDAYKRSSVASESGRTKDPANELWSYFQRRRLNAEEIRDTTLQVSGKLNLKMGGDPVVPPLEAEELYGIIGRPESAWVVSSDAREHSRRSIYMLRRRTFQQPMMEAFDSPDGVLSCARRNEGTTAPQSLAMLNSRFMVKEAEAAAARVESAEDVFRRVLGRAPAASEKKTADEFLARQADRLGSRRAALAELARGLMNINEYLYVD